MNAVDYHSLIAEKFDAAYQRSAAFRERLALWETLIQRYGGSGGRVLDAGCGTGAMTLLAARYNREVVAVDASEAMIAICQAKQRALGLQNILTLRADLENLEVSGAFGLILCSSVLEYVPAPWVLLKRLAGLLAPNGTVVFSLPNRASVYRRLEAISYRISGRPRYFAYVRHLARYGDVESRLPGLGLQALEHHYYGKTPVWSDAMRALGRPQWADNLIAVACRRADEGAIRRTAGGSP